MTSANKTRKLRTSVRLAVFSNIFYVTNGDGRPGVIGDECDLAICKANPTDGLSSPDAFPLINGSNSGFDPDISVGDNLLCYGPPDISGPYLTDRTIAYNPSSIQLAVTNFEQSGMIGVARIEGIEDYSGNTYPINSSLNGLSGGPIFRANGHSECFSGMAIMAGNGV